MNEFLLTNAISSAFSGQLPIFNIIPFFGSVAFAIMVLGYIMLFKTEKLKLYFYTYLLVGGIVWVLKRLVDRIRPNEAIHSFPSGHSALAFTFAMLMYLDNKKNWPAFVLAGFVAFSRLALGVHYLSDIIFGGVLAMLITICVYNYEK